MIYIWLYDDIKNAKLLDYISSLHITEIEDIRIVYSELDWYAKAENDIENLDYSKPKDKLKQFIDYLDSYKYDEWKVE